MLRVAILAIPSHGLSVSGFAWTNLPGKMYQACKHDSITCRINPQRGADWIPHIRRAVHTMVPRRGLPIHQCRNRSCIRSDKTWWNMEDKSTHPPCVLKLRNLNLHLSFLRSLEFSWDLQDCCLRFHQLEHPWGGTAWIRCVSHDRNWLLGVTSEMSAPQNTSIYCDFFLLKKKMGVWQPKTKNCFHISSYFHGVFMDKPSLREGPHQRSANLTYPSHRMPCLPPDVANDRASWRLRHLISARCRRNRFKVILNNTNIRNHWRIHWNWYNSVVGDYLFLALCQMNWVFIASTTAPRRIPGRLHCKPASLRTGETLLRTTEEAGYGWSRCLSFSFNARKIHFSQSCLFFL